MGTNYIMMIIMAQTIQRITYSQISHLYDIIFIIQKIIVIQYPRLTYDTYFATFPQLLEFKHIWIPAGRIMSWGLFTIGVIDRNFISGNTLYHLFQEIFFTMNGDFQHISFGRYNSIEGK